MLRLAREAGVPAGMLGKGSDIVVADAGIRGLVIRNRADGIELDGTTVRAEAGAAMAALVKRCTAAGLAGFEFGISIPGSLRRCGVGQRRRARRRDEGRRRRASTPGGRRDEARTLCRTTTARFAYRDSRFKDGAEVVLARRSRSRPGDPAEIAARVAEHQAQRRRPSRWPTRTRAASSATRRATMPGA